MKELFSIIFILFTQFFYAQWVQQVSGVSANLNDVYCITENIVVVVGDNGTILKTTDGGANWVEKSSGTIESLNIVRFASQNVGYTINYSGNLYKTINGGESWNAISSILVSNIFDLSCVNENIFYSTSNNNLYKTINGGVSFQTINTSQFLQNIQFINEIVGFASAYGELLKTSDGGYTWTNIGNVNSISLYSAFYFVNDSVGFKLSNQDLYKTTDGGNTYTYLSTINHTMLKLFAPSENIIWGVNAVFLLNGQPNYTTRGEILDGVFQRIDASSPLLKSIYFANPTTGYALGEGHIYKNVTGTMLGLNEVDSTENIKIYPNPTSNQITISLNENNNQSFTIEITDSLGKKIYSNYYKQNNITINTEKFLKGIYFLTIINNNKSQTQKIIIN